MKLFGLIALILVLATPANAAIKRQLKLRKLLIDVRRQEGTPYVWGAEQPRRGFDCSGLVQWAFRRIGVFLPRTTWGMLGRGMRVPRRLLKPGDVIFFWNGEHVAIYLGGGRFIDAPHTGSRVGVRTLSSYGGFFQARRFLS